MTPEQISAWSTNNWIIALIEGNIWLIALTMAFLKQLAIHTSWAEDNKVYQLFLAFFSTLVNFRKPKNGMVQPDTDKQKHPSDGGSGNHPRDS